MKKRKLYFIGSLPHRNPVDAVRFVKKHSLHLPFLPQLPDLNPLEDMIGQVLRGIDLGCWDEKASSCLELFQNEFVDSSRFKIQIAGPYTVSKSMSGKFRDVAPLWVGFWRGLVKQLQEAAFKGELWLQIDEPFWTQEQPYIVEGYTAFLQTVKDVDFDVRVGIHSCATLRPLPFVDHLSSLDFFAFDFASKAMGEHEERYYLNLMREKDKSLIFGGLTKGTVNLPKSLENEPNFWLSAPCGFYGWDIRELDKQMEQWEKV